MTFKMFVTLGKMKQLLSFSCFKLFLLYRPSKIHHRSTSIDNANEMLIRRAKKLSDHRFKDSTYKIMNWTKWIGLCMFKMPKLRHSCLWKDNAGTIFKPSSVNRANPLKQNQASHSFKNRIIIWPDLGQFLTIIPLL